MYCMKYLIGWVLDPFAVIHLGFVKYFLKSRCRSALLYDGLPSFPDLRAVPSYIDLICENQNIERRCVIHTDFYDTC